MMLSDLRALVARIGAEFPPHTQVVFTDYSRSGMPALEVFFCARRDGANIVPSHHVLHGCVHIPLDRARWVGRVTKPPE